MSMDEKIHAIEVDLRAMRNDLIELAGYSKETVEFIHHMQEVVSQMSESPMLKAMGMGTLKMPEMSKLPGM